MAQRLAGHATPEGTKRLADRTPGWPEDARRQAFGLTLSSVGLGTYLGDPGPAKDHGYHDAIVAALRGGINVIDTAINYREQRSERVVGAAVRALVRDALVARDELFVSTKGGFVPGDADAADPRQAIQDAYVATGLLTRETFVAGCHCMSPAYLADQVRRSRDNLGLETLDLYYVHNPETQLGAGVAEDEFYGRLGEAFRQLERSKAAGHIARYGIATWDGLRTPPGEQGHLSLSRVIAAAKEAADAEGAPGVGLGAVQAPLNLAMPEAVTATTQRTAAGATVPLAEALRASGLAFFTSGSILQGRLARGIPRGAGDRIRMDGTPAQVALQATRSAPGVTTALIGMSQVPHVDEALDLLLRVKTDASIWNGAAG